MEDAPKLLKIPNDKIFGYVNQNINGLNHGPAWKTQSFLLSEICMVILWQDCNGKGNSRKFYWNKVGKKFQIGNACLIVNREKDFLVCLCGGHKNWLGRNKTLSQCGEYSCKNSIWANRHHSLTMFIWVALKENVKQTTITGTCSNPESLLEQKKTTLFREAWRRHLFMVL